MMRKSLLVVLLLSTSLPSYAVKDNKTLDVLAEMNTAGIYDQRNVYMRFPKVLEQEGLNSLVCSSNEETMEKETELSTVVSLQTTDRFIQELQKEFISRKRKAMGRVLSERGLPFALDFGCTTCFGLSGFLGPFGAGMALFKALKSCETFTGDLSSSVSKIYDPKTDELFKYELEYVAIKRFLPETLQRSIEDRFATSRKDAKILKETLTEFLPMVLNLPTHRKKPSAMFEEKIRGATKGYIVKGDKSLADILIDVAMTHYSNYREGVGHNPSAKPILYLVGPAGVGKTYIAKILADSLEVPLDKVPLTGGTAKVFGDRNNPGQYLEAISYPGSVLNSVKFFDEANHSLNGGVVSKNHPGTDVINPTKTKLTQNSDQATWLEVFDPETKEKSFPYLNAKFPIGDSLDILAANDVPQNKAARNRMIIVEITGLLPEFKKEIVWSHIFPKIIHSDDPLMAITIQKLQNDRKEIDLIIQEAEKKEEIIQEEKKEKEKKKEELQLLDEDEDDEDIGFRTIKKDLQTYINKIRLQRLREFNMYKREEQDKKKHTTQDDSIVDITIGSKKENIGLRKRNSDNLCTLNAENIDRFMQLSQY